MTAPVKAAPRTTLAVLPYDRRLPIPLMMSVYRRTSPAQRPRTSTVTMTMEKTSMWERVLKVLRSMVASERTARAATLIPTAMSAYSQNRLCFGEVTLSLSSCSCIDTLEAATEHRLPRAASLSPSPPLSRWAGILP